MHLCHYESCHEYRVSPNQVVCIYTSIVYSNSRWIDQIMRCLVLVTPSFFQLAFTPTNTMRWGRNWLVTSNINPNDLSWSGFTTSSTDISPYPNTPGLTLELLTRWSQYMWVIHRRLWAKETIHLIKAE